MATAACFSITILAISAAALVLLLGGTSSAEERGAQTIAARGHGGHGGVAGTTAAAANAQLPDMEPGMNMVGDAVRAPGGPHATDALLNLPPAQPYEPGRLRQFTLRVEEHDIEVADGLKFPAWTYVQPGHTPAAPGPTLRVTEGDRVRITMENASTQPHSLHTHGIHPADQDGVLDMVQPGQSFTYEFTAGPSGVQPYHCHAMPLLKHIGKGMYGMIIIDPKVPPKAVADREMSMVMSAFDTNYDGTNEVYTVNGLAFHYAKYPIRVKRGELNRIYLENMTE
ncbi:MAG: multicopper oxidase, type 3, partial [Thermoleophilia bacterium]|nr:multicopper oxidase, type 3 [Thermoleophilia bacterium]